MKNLDLFLDQHHTAIIVIAVVTGYIYISYYIVKFFKFIKKTDNMLIEIFRTPCQGYTIGKLFITGQFFCNTLEDQIRDLNHNGKFDQGEIKIPTKTAIPCGSYDMIINYSNRFKRPMPRLLNVPGFNGILIHSGNTQEDTAGCILLGENKVKGMVINSTSIFKTFYERISKYLISSKFQSIKVIIYDQPYKNAAA
jgi:hypothetical protein